MTKKVVLPRVDMSIRADAARFRWLMSRRGLNLCSVNSNWIAQDGTQFTSTHYLAADDTCHGPAPSLREIIDCAMENSK